MPCPHAPTPAVAAAAATRRDRGRRTRARILGSAVTLFARQDYDAVSLRQITAAIQVNMSLITFHFGGKEALYLEAVRLAGRAGLAEVRRLPAPPGPGAADAARRAAASLAANIALFITLGRDVRRGAGPDPQPDLRASALALLGRALGSPRADARQALQGVLEAQREHLDGCLRALRPDLDAEARFRIGSSIVGQGLLYFLFPALVDRARGPAGAEPDPDTLARSLTRFCLAGIRHVRPGSP